MIESSLRSIETSSNHLILKLLYTNIKFEEESQIDIFLVNHQNNYSKIVENHLNCKLHIDSVLLVEDPKEVRKWSKFAYTFCWENPEFIDGIAKVESVFTKFYRSLLYLTSANFPQEDKINTINQLFLNDPQLKLTKHDINKDILMNYLNNLDQYSNDLEVEKTKLIEWLKKIRQVYVHQTIHKTFSKRQSSLIECTKKHLMTHKKVFVICGRNHGAPCSSSPFSTEAQRFLDFLNLHARFKMYDLC